MKISIFPMLYLCTACILACGSAHAELKFYASGSDLPFSDAVQVDHMLYLSGQIGMAPGENQLVAGGVENEAKQAMDNIGAVLSRRGLGFDAIVKCTVMLAEMADWPTFNKIYVTYFKPGRLPARSAFGGVALAYDGRLEIECWAHNPGGKIQ